MNIPESSYGYWSSSRSFVWVATGASVGISTLTRVPYLMGEYGGAAFLITYVAALLLIGMPLLMAEWMLGRWMRRDLVSGFRHLAESVGLRPAWRLLGIVALAGAVLILSYYSVIAGWSMAYAFRVSAGYFSGMSDAAATEVFIALARDPERSLSWHTIFMIIACVIVAHGFREGIERAALRLMPAAALLVLALCAYAVTVRDPLPALAYLFAPDFAALGWRGVLEAMHQAFFTLSLGIGVMLTLGVYLPARAPLGGLAVTVLSANVAFSVFAGIAVMSIVLGAGLQPEPGLAMIFQVLPRSLPEGLGGSLFGVGFFLALFLVTLSSAAALLEPLTRYLMDRHRWTRVFAATSGALLVWYLGLGTLLSFSVIQHFELGGRNFFEWVQFLTAGWLAPLTALMICVLMVSIVPGNVTDALWGERQRWFAGVWRKVLRYPGRIGLIVILLYSTGLLDALIQIWNS